MRAEVEFYIVLIQQRQFLMGTNAVQGSTAKIDRLGD